VLRFCSTQLDQQGGSRGGRSAIGVLPNSTPDCKRLNRIRPMVLFVSCNLQKVVFV
jgi:hypothetical protein